MAAGVAVGIEGILAFGNFYHKVKKHDAVE
jgi:hypothetical protein